MSSLGEELIAIPKSKNISEICVTKMEAEYNPLAVSVRPNGNLINILP
jgi:hypothetical protein